MLRLFNAAVAFLTTFHLATSQTYYNETIVRLPDVWEPLLKQWDQPFDAHHRKQLAGQAAEMFSHAYTSYMQYGYPADNVKPKSCRPEDVQGGVAVTLLDSLDALLIFGKTDEFKAAAQLVEHEVHFNSSGEVHVFELTIRALGGLLSAHVATASQPRLVPGYSGAFLAQARALADRLLPAFDTPTGIPLSWISLARGQLPGTVRNTCLACATTLTLEFRLLSHLTGDRRYEAAVDAAVAAVYARRHPSTGLLGNTLSTDSGRWERGDAGIGPGADSFYEYLLKTYLVFGDERYLDMFAEQYVRVQRYMAVPGSWRGAAWVLDVSMGSLEALKQWVSSLSAFWPGVQASVGQLDAAHRLMSEYVRAQLRFGWLPEQIQYHLNTMHPQEVGYPLRPELIESAYMLWSAAREPRYLRVAEGMLAVLSRFNRCECGFCAVRNVSSGELDDAMESFFLAETTKYLFLLLSNATAVNDFFVFSTEGHLLPVLPAHAAEPSSASSSTRAAPSAADSTPTAPEPQAAAGGGAEDGNEAGAGEDAACADICAEPQLAELLQQAQAAQAEFPSLTFDAEAALRLRRRRCRACRAVHNHFAALPALPPCDAARRLGVPLDQPCPPPPRDTPAELVAKFTAAVMDIETLQAQMVAAASSFSGGDSASSIRECAAPQAEGGPARDSGAQGNPDAQAAAGGGECGATAPDGGPPGMPREGSTRDHAASTPHADTTARGRRDSEAAAAQPAPSVQDATATLTGMEPLDFASQDGHVARSARADEGSVGTCGAMPNQASGMGGPDVVAYALCLLEPKASPRGLLQCSQTRMISAAGLPLAMLPALLPSRVLIAEAAVSLRHVRPSAATVTLSAILEGRREEQGCAAGEIALAVLRAAGAAFGPELPKPRGPEAGSEGADADVLCGRGFREAMAALDGGSECASLHEWLQHRHNDHAAAGTDAAAGSEKEPRGQWVGEGGLVRGRLVVASPGTACEPLQPRMQPEGAGIAYPEHENYRDAIVVVQRGGCMFLEKVMHAQAAGARGVIIVNNEARVAPSSAAGMSQGGHGHDEEAGSGADVFFMDRPGHEESRPWTEPDIPSVMLSHADGSALISALACMHDNSTDEGFFDVRPDCVHRQLTAELAVDAGRSQDDDVVIGGSATAYEVSWKLITHTALAEDIKQLEDEVGSHIGSGWDHAVSAFAPHLTTLIDDWLQQNVEALA